MSENCKRCEGKTLEGKRCKNMVACHSGCHAYCHVHSKGYPKTNVLCTTPKRKTLIKKKKVSKK